MAIKDHSLKPNIGLEKADPLADLDDTALLTLRGQIDKRLRLDPKQLNLAEELGYQYRAGMTLMASIQDDKETPANQRSQVFNSVGAMLSNIIKQQKVVYDAERLKRFESAFIKVLEDLPVELKRKFFDLYSQYLTDESTHASA